MAIYLDKEKGREANRQRQEEHTQRLEEELRKRREKRAQIKVSQSEHGGIQVQSPVETLEKVTQIAQLGAQRKPYLSNFRPAAATVGQKVRNGATWEAIPRSTREIGQLMQEIEQAGYRKMGIRDIESYPPSQRENLRRGAVQNTDPARYDLLKKAYAQAEQREKEAHRRWQEELKRRMDELAPYVKPSVEGVTPKKLTDETLEEIEYNGKLYRAYQAQLDSNAFMGGMVDEFADRLTLGGSSLLKDADEKAARQGDPLIWATRLGGQEEANPGAYHSGQTAGALAHSALMYQTVGKAAENLVGKLFPNVQTAISQIDNPALRKAAEIGINLAGQQASDTAVRTPSVIAKGIAEGKSAGEIAKEVGQQQLDDFVMNLLFAGGYELYDVLRRQSRAAGEVAQASSFPQTKWFEGVENLEDLKKRHRSLAKHLHPDATGLSSSDAFVEMTREFETLYDYFKGTESAAGAVESAVKETASSVSDGLQDFRADHTAQIGPKKQLDLTPVQSVESGQLPRRAEEDVKSIDFSVADHTAGANASPAADPVRTVMERVDAANGGRLTPETAQPIMEAQDAGGQRRQAGEALGSFVSRAREQGMQVEDAGGGDIIAYRPTPPEEISAYAAQVQEVLSRYGVQSVVHTGDFWSNRDGMTTAYATSARTHRDGDVVYIRNDGQDPLIDTAMHELFHVARAKAPELTARYLNALRPAGDDTGYQEMLQYAGDFIFGDRYNPQSARQNAVILEELGAQLGGKWEGDRPLFEYIVTKYRLDAEQIAAAWNELADSLRGGFGDENLGGNGASLGRGAEKRPQPRGNAGAVDAFARQEVPRWGAEALNQSVRSEVVGELHRPTQPGRGEIGDENLGGTGASHGRGSGTGGQPRGASGTPDPLARTEIRQEDGQVVPGGSGDMGISKRPIQPGRGEIDAQGGPEKEITGGYGPNTVGSAQRGESKSAEDLVGEYGALPKGENPARDVSVPRRTDAGKTMRFARTAAESGAVSDEMAKTIVDEVANDTFSYVPESNKSAMDTAAQRLEHTGFEAAFSEFERLLTEGKRLSPSDIALGEQLLTQAARDGDVDRVIQLSADLAAVFTEAGQEVQAAKMLKRMTPQGNLVYVQRAVEKLNQRARGKYTVELPKENVQDILSQTTQEGLTEAAERAATALANQMPADLTDKLTAWRYMSMLGNPRTHIRNILGNATMIPLRYLKNAIGAGMESGVNQVMRRIGKAPIERTKAILTPKDKTLLQFAREDYDRIAPALQAGGKVNFEDKITQQRRIFETGFLEWLRKKNFDLLEKEDAWFLQRAYVSSMAQYMKANRLTPEFLQSGTRAANEALSKAQKYAQDEALKATYRDASKVAKALNDFKRINGVTKFLGEGVIPFTKTPINVLKRGVEYSPAGLLQSVTLGVRDLGKGKINAPQFIDRLAAGLSGTGIAVLGALLASMGIVRTGDSRSSRDSAYGGMLGEQEYAIVLPNGATFTIDWMAPSVMPFMVGAEFYEQMQSEEGITWKNALSRTVDALSNVSDPLFNLSMLQGISSLTGSYQQGTMAKVGDVLGNSAVSYLSQYIPTVFGQIARTIDPTVRTSYSPKDSALTKTGESALRKNMAKLPGLSYLLEPSVDLWGRERQNEGGILGRAVQNFLSPGYYEAENITEVDREILKLQKKTADSGVVPKYPEKSLTYKEETYPLSSKEYTQYAKTKGRLSYETIEGMLDSPLYDELSDGERAEAVKDAYEYANAAAKKEFLEGKGTDFTPSGWTQKAAAAAAEGIPVDDYILIRLVTGEIASVKDRDGDAIPLSRSVLIRQKLDAMDWESAAQKKTAYEAFGVSKTVQEMSAAEFRAELAELRSRAS